MDVNTDIWGLPATWVDGTSAEQNADIKYPAAAKDTFKEQYTSGGIPYNEIDVSLAFWGIGKDCIFCNPQYLAPYCIGGDINTIDVYQEPIKQTKTEQPAIFSHGGLTAVSISYTRRWSYYTAAEIEADTQHRIPIGTAYTEQLYAAMNYQKIMLIPYVEVISDTYTTGAYTAYTLYDYIENQGYNTKQRIVGIGFMTRYGDGINADRSSENKGTSLVFSFDVPGKDVAYNSKQFYAHDTGMSYLSWSDGSGGCRVPMGINTPRISGNATVGTADTGFRAKYCPTNDGTSVPWYFYDPDDPIWTVNKTTAPGSGSTVFWYAYPYIAVNSTNADDVKNYVLKQIAYIGLPFAYDPDNAARGQIGDIGIFLPVFDNNGITTGNYKEGTDALRLPNSEWTDGREGAGYDPNITPQGDLDNSELSKTLYYSSNKYYVMNQSQLNTFLNTINGLYTGGTTPEEKAEEIQDMQVQFKGSNPADYIVGLYGVPLDITRWGTTPSIPVMLGPVEIMDSTAAVQGITLSDILYPVLYFNSVNNIPGFGDFRDYAPYTTLELYVPYCGTVQLDPAMYIGHGVTLEGLLDIQTGEMCVRVLRDGITVTNTITGNIYVSLPITSQAMGTYENSIHQLQMAAFNREFGLLTGAVTGGVSMGSAAAAGGEGEGGGGGMISPTAPISMAANLIQLPIAMADYDYRITHCQPSVAYTSACSPANNVQFYRRAKLFVKRPVMLSSYTTAEGKAAYAHTVGHACSIIGTITSSGISGFCQIGSIDLSGIPATVEEIQAIKQALNKGVYV